MSYSVRNQPVIGNSQPGTPVQSPRQLAPSSERELPSLSLSQILSNVSGGDELVSVAFKSLPVDPARWRVGGGGAGEGSRKGPETCKEAVEEMVTEVRGVCEGAGVVDDEGFITDKDIVRCVCSRVHGVPSAARSEKGGADWLTVCVPSVAEAQRSTTLYAKFEYSLKRLLWLGG